MAVKLLKLKDVCERVAFTPKTIRKWVTEGKFPRPVVAPGGDLRWHEIAIEAWASQLELAKLEAVSEEAVKRK